MGTLEMNDPLDLEAKIVDMQAKMKYISKQIDDYNQKKTTDRDQIKLEKLEKKAKKLEEKWKKDVEKMD